MNTILLCVLIFLATACSSERPSTTGKQAFSGDVVSAKSEAVAGKTGSDHVLEISPRNARRESVLFVVPKDVSLADGQIEWRVNGRAVPGATSSQFSASDLKRGDVVQASVKGPGFTAVSKDVEIINSPPVISSMKFAFNPGNVISMDATANDADGDPVTISYEWSLNGQTVGTGQQLDSKVKRGDKISVKAKPYDGMDFGPIAVLDREIANMPPVITDHKEFTFDGTTYTYQVKAADPDGDKLTFALASSPNGMTIDSSTGLIKWVVPSAFKGTQPVSVTVNDGNGGTAQYNIKIIIP